MLNDFEFAQDKSPARPGIVDYPAPAYSRVWRPLSDQLDPLHRKSAPRFYLEAKRISIAEHQGVIPQIARISDQLARTTGFRLIEADAKVDGPIFLRRLAKRIFSATTFLRGMHELDFSPQPDLVHEYFGHAIPLCDQHIADLYEHFGRVALGLQSQRGMDQLERLFWYSAETGVVREDGGSKAFGGALLSSVAELEGLSHYPTIPFDPGRISVTLFEADKRQRLVFEAPSVSDLLDSLHDYLSFMSRCKDL